MLFLYYLLENTLRVRVDSSLLLEGPRNVEFLLPSGRKVYVWKAVRPPMGRILHLYAGSPTSQPNPSYPQIDFSDSPLASVESHCL